MGSKSYGTGDATFQAAGGEAGIRALIDSFYDIMSSDPRFKRIIAWHPEDNEISRDKLARFLCGWMGGPRRYSEKFGGINIIKVHNHLSVTAVESEQWLACMHDALHQQNYPTSLNDYLLEQLAVPADRIRVACEKQP